MGLNDSIIKIRVELQNSKLTKSGENKHANFKYYELADFLPRLNELMEKEGVNDIFTIKGVQTILKLVKGEESQEYELPFERFETPKNRSGQPLMQEIQYLGALNTYYKRYLYLNAFGITDGEVIDGMENPPTPPQNQALPQNANNTNYGERLMDALIAKGLDANTYGIKYGLNQQSTQGELKKHYEMIIKLTKEELEMLKSELANVQANAS